MFDLNTELNDAVSFNVADSVLDVSTSDLEAELESLLAEDQAAPSSGKDTIHTDEVRRGVGNLSIRESGTYYPVHMEQNYLNPDLDHDLDQGILSPVNTRSEF